MVERQDPYALPSPEILQEIERRQTENERSSRQKRAESLTASEEQINAAKIIQRNYRGHRTRRALNGHGLDPGTRWLEALNDARFTQLTRPQSRAETMSLSPGSKGRVKSRWLRAGAAANRAANDYTSASDPEGEDDAAHASERERRRQAKLERDKAAKIMGVEYFLEMVDEKHRYGSNLRRYHQEWVKAETQDNFFYWLDHGDGLKLDLEDRPRKRLDTEQVRYLSREDRLQYLVKIDSQGRFCWAKDGSPVTTSVDFKDSIEGIVPAQDETPTWREVTTGVKPPPPLLTSDSSSDSSGTMSTGSREDSAKYTNEDFHNAKGLSKLNHISVDALTNHLLRKTTKKNTWIFVADTSFRLYIGIKQSGAFQHSSFLKGARVSAAGLIKIKRGQIRSLSPLSGHYAPPVQNFRLFVKSLKEAGADLTRLNISKSYAVILGLEGYIGVKKRVQRTGQGIKDVFQPDEKKRREEETRDKSQSAQLERAVLEREARAKKEQSVGHKLMRKLGLHDNKDETKEMAAAGAGGASFGVVSKSK